MNAILVALSLSLPSHAADAVATPPPTADASVEVTTLNTWGLPYPVAWVDRRDRYPRIESFLAESEIDVVGLQEVWSGARSLLQLDGLRGGSSDIDTGLALVSPHPTSQVTEVPYRASRGVDRLKDKGVLSARVDVPETGALQVFVTHLQAGGGARNAEVRQAQVDELVAMVGAVSVPVVVMGDFNFDPDQPADRAAARRLVDVGLSDAAAAVGEGRATHPRDGRRYDRIYLRGDATRDLAATDAEVIQYGDAEDPLAEGLQQLSDHLPLWVKAALTD